MAAKKDAEIQENVTKQNVAKEKKWTVKVKSNPEYCGIGAGGVQFANGEAVITSARMAAWFEEHNGYEVVEQ